MNEGFTLRCGLIVPTPTAADMAAWTEEGKRDQKSVLVYRHASAAFKRGLAEADCPFGDEAPEARERWLWMFRMVARQARKTDVHPDRPVPAAPDKARETRDPPTEAREPIIPAGSPGGPADAWRRRADING